LWVEKCGSRNQKAWSVLSIEIVGGCPVRVFFCGEFSPPGDPKKKGLANPTKGFLRIKKTIRHILRKKKLKVARFTQLCSIRSPELGRIPKKIY
jgi:hypothetical protein